MFAGERYFLVVQDICDYDLVWKLQVLLNYTVGFTLHVLVKFQ